MAAIQTNDFANVATDLGSAVTDLFGAQGATASAKSYDQAAAIADQNAQLTQQETAIKETQQSRQIYKTIGSQTAGVAGAGFSGGGTAGDLLRDSSSQGALAKAMTADQGAITENSYAEQAGMFRGMSAAASSSSTAQTVSGIIQGAGGAYNLAKGVGNITNNLFSSGTALPAGATELASGAMTGAGSLASYAGGVADVTGVGSGLAGAGLGAATDLGTAATVDALGTTAADVIGGSVAADAAATIGTTVAADAGASLIGDVVVAAAPLGWIVCTELHKQGRMSSRIYYGAASSFIAYPERVKRGYYVWAIPSTKHLRAHPGSWYSNLLDRTFNCRAGYISAKRRGKPTTLTGALVTHGLYAFCWVLSWFVPKSLANWESLYATHTDI